MENKEKIERTEHFLSFLRTELNQLEKADLSYMQFVILGQAIEVMGSFLDNKPMKAKDQSAKRFNAAIDYLLGGKYRIANEKRGLYHKLRNQLTHTFIPGKELMLVKKKQNTSGAGHMEYQGGRLILVAEDFFADVYRAMEKLAEGLKSGLIKPKNIAFGDEK